MIGEERIPAIDIPRDGGRWWGLRPATQVQGLGLLRTHGFCGMQGRVIHHGALLHSLLLQDVLKLPQRVHQFLLALEGHGSGDRRLESWMPGFHAKGSEVACGQGVHGQ